MRYPKVSRVAYIVLDTGIIRDVMFYFEVHVNIGEHSALPSNSARVSRSVCHYCKPYFVLPVLLRFRCSGDLIAEVDGKEVTGVRDVLEAIGMHVNRTFEFKLLREGKPVTVNLTTEPEPAAKQ